MSITRTLTVRELKHLIPVRSMLTSMLQLRVIWSTSGLSVVLFPHCSLMTALVGSDGISRGGIVTFRQYLINVPAAGRPGASNMLKAPFRLIIILPLTMVIWLKTRPVMLSRRATNMTATFSLWPTCRRSVRTFLAALRLSVSAVLLYSRTLGPPVSVCVTDICRPRLFDRSDGQSLTPPLKLISVSSLWTCVDYRVPGHLLVPSVNLTPPLIAIPATRPNFRKTKLTPPCRLCSRLFPSVATLSLLTIIRLFAGCLSRPTACINADPFVLEKFMTLKTLFPLMSTPIRPIVLMACLFLRKAMDMLPSLTMSTACLLSYLSIRLSLPNMPRLTNSARIQGLHVPPDLHGFPHHCMSQCYYAAGPLKLPNLSPVTVLPNPRSVSSPPIVPLKLKLMLRAWIMNILTMLLLRPLTVSVLVGPKLVV